MESLTQTGEIVDGKYVVDEIIGEGGMGLVVAARHLQLGTPVAIKLLHTKAGGLWRERFLREARAASQIDSEHVARVFDVGRLFDGTPYMVMELLSGCDLADIVYGQGPLSVSDAVSYCRQACAALSAAHRRGIVHRDVKPANLFLSHRADGSPCIKLLDFGISKVGASVAGRSGKLTRTGSLLGSPQFMSPEQLLSSRDVDQRSDVWSLGVTLFELLTAEMAFEAEAVAELYSAILRDPPRRLRELRPEVPAALEAVVLRCLEKDLSRRVQSADELSELLATALTDVVRVESLATDSVAELPASYPADDRGQAIALMATQPMEWRSEIGEALPSAAPSGSEIDETPAGSVRPVARAISAPARRVGVPLGGGLLAGSVLGVVAAVALLSTSPEVPRLGAIPQVVVAAAMSAPSVPSALSAQSPSSAPTFVDSARLDGAQRERLDDELSAAAAELSAGRSRPAAERVRAVVHELSELGIKRHQAISSLGAKSELLLGRLEAARIDELLVALRAGHGGGGATEVNTAKLERRLARARAAYERVRSWGVRSFFRCGLVEMASLDRDASAAFSLRASGAVGAHRKRLLGRARRYLRNARVGYRHAIDVKAETMLCMAQARAGHHEASRALSALPD